MRLNNQINQIIFKQVLNNTSSVTVAIPSNVNNIQIVMDSILPTVGGASLLLQTAPSSGIFDTAGYQSGFQFVNWANNAWGNQTTTAALILGVANNTNEYDSGYAYVTDFNTSNNVNLVGSVALYADFAGGIYYNTLIGRSPTTMATQIKIFFSSGVSMASGTFTVYAF